jgi:hypothetical protein
VAGKIYRPALIRLFQQLAAMQSGLGDQSVVVFSSETSRAVKRACNNTHRLELRSGVTDGVFVNSKSLRKELVAELLESSLVCYLSAEDE